MTEAKSRSGRFLSSGFRPLASWVRWLSRAQDHHIMAAAAEALDEALQGHGNPIDFGREGFGNEREFQRREWMRRYLSNKKCFDFTQK